MLAQMGVLQAVVAKQEHDMTAAQLASQTGCDELLISEWRRQPSCVALHQL